MKIQVNGNDYEVEINGDKALVNGKEIDLKIIDEQTIIISAKHFNLDFVEEGDPSLIIVNGTINFVSKSVSDSLATKALRAPISGQIMEVSVSEGEEVKRGQLLVVLEAMKMENVIKSPGHGIVKAIRVKAKDPVEKGQVLVELA